MSEKTKVKDFILISSLMLAIMVKKQFKFQREEDEMTTEINQTSQRAKLNVEHFSTFFILKQFLTLRDLNVVLKKNFKAMESSG